VPHVGWNSLEIRRPSRLLAGIEPGAQAYFTHSYAADITPEAVATTTHAAPFASVVETDLLFGVQFHPEKSGNAGIQMLRNFVAVCSPSA
jgi:glutamine amidotransferase